ncbi:PocR ligand-binding domain-containing protein [Methanosphaerula palustris]|uniref:PocR ligand-binding domain-containing protein n=1 Tax=Methanosphaerula palustris TaxID=475088 RepID=UPI000A05F27D|nr:PocR ligand-binding domain-containing protein [Methanosphaerula palustris]
MTVGGLHVGNIISGQFFFEDEAPDFDLFRAQARRYGFDEEAYITVIQVVPRDLYGVPRVRAPGRPGSGRCGLLGISARGEGQL